MSKSIVLLVDGSSYLYRAYHALPDLRAPDGTPTGAVHGFIAMMKWLRQRYPARFAACVFDAKGPTFRDELFPAYKAHRPSMPEPLVQQIALIHEAVRLLGWAVLEVPGIEADDAIGTLARVAAAGGNEVVISTGDKDLTQLVKPRVTLVNTMARPPERLDAAAVQAKFGVPPERIVDYLTLVGDSVDGVPGVDKVGPKTAVRWLAEHGSLDAIVAAAADIKGAAGDKLREALAWLPTGRKLVTVVTDCDLGAQVPGWPALDALALREPDRPGLLAFYHRHGFRTWSRELEAAGVAADAAAAAGADAAAAAAPPAAELAHEYETVTRRERLEA
ncbi:MAG: DNA polymerase I, partial [Comamonadaceae bacterium]|nr:DNA polymerase I [Comamonadaceae bacterium]